MFRIITVSCIFLFMSACGMQETNNNEPVTLVAGQSKASNHPVSLGVDKLAELVEEKSDGEIIIETHHDGILGSDRSVIESAQEGSMDIAASSTPNMSGFTNIFLAWDLPFIFENKDEVYEAVDGEPGEIAKKDLEEKGLVTLSFLDYGFRQFVNNQREVRLPEDMQGMRVRTTNSPIEISDFIAWGGAPSPISWGETFTALQQGTIESEGNSYSLLWDSSHHEVLDYVTEINYNYSADAVVINKDTFNELSDEHQQILIEAGEETTKWQRDVANAAEEEAKQNFIDFGLEIYEPDDDEMQIWRQESEIVWQEHIDEGEIDQEYIDIILDTLDKSYTDIFREGENE